MEPKLEPQPEEQHPPASKPVLAANSHRFTLILLASALLVCAASLFWQGIDFSLGVVLGCLIVGLNYLWTRAMVLAGLREGRFRSRAALAYLVKFALTLVVLFIALTRFGIDPVAILVGVSSLLLAVLALLALHTVT